MKSLQEGKFSLATDATTLYPGTKWYMPLQALGVASKMHQSLSTTPSMNVTGFKLESSRWFSVLKSEIKQKALLWYALPKVSMSSAFGCVIFFDAGNVDLNASELQNVMAVSIDDSMYVSATLTSDRYDTPEEHTTYRTLGNVGKPGVSLLIPPANPRMRKVMSEEWRLVNHDEYNFQPEDSFEETSLHLWLKEYRMPYATNHRGSRNLQAFFQEAVISVYGRSDWVRDLDVIKALCPSPNMIRRSPGVCLRKQKSDDRRKATSLDDHYELFDQPEDLAAVRADGNWLGGLATAVLSVQLGIPVVILPG